MVEGSPKLTQPDENAPFPLKRPLLGGRLLFQLPESFRKGSLFFVSAPSQGRGAGELCLSPRERQVLVNLGEAGKRVNEVRMKRGKTLKKKKKDEKKRKNPRGGPATCGRAG